jgi:hypothetical protein
MAEQLKKTKVTVDITSTSGLSLKYKMEGGADTNPSTASPDKALLKAIEELSWLLHVYDFGKEAEARFLAGKERHITFMKEKQACV